METKADVAPGIDELDRRGDNESETQKDKRIESLEKKNLIWIIDLEHFMFNDLKSDLGQILEIL